MPEANAVEPLTALPSTVSHIGYHAARRPGDVALIVNGQEIAYGAFYRDIGKMVAALRGFGLEPGDAAGVEHPHLYLHWLLLLAFEALGVSTFSYARGEAAMVEEALAGTALVMCSPGQEPAIARRAHPMDTAWIDSVAETEPDRPLIPAPIGPDTPIRIVKSSGTTGSFKRMIHTGRVHEFWIRQYQLRAGFNRNSRYLVTAGFHFQVFHVVATACIRMGGACVYDEREGIANALSKYAITHATCVPRILIQVLDNLPENYVKAPELTVFTVGAPVPNAVRARTKRVLANNLVESYGTTEVAVICTMGEDGVGTVMPGVLVEVLNDDGQPVMGEPGLVRVMTEGSVGGYVDNPEATGRMFRDGWFYPGDVGVMQDRRTVRIIGRADDQLNIGGTKFPPQPLEAELASNLPVDDLCLTTMADGEGVHRVWVVLVLRNPDGMADILPKIGPMLPAMFGEVKLVAMEKIPRTDTGKILRNKVNELLRQAQVD